MDRVKDKVIIVTGGANGIGAAIVRALATEGAAVVIADMADERGIEYAEQLKEETLRARYIHLDVTSLEDWDECVATTKGLYGKIDGLVNCAALSQASRGLDNLDLDRDWHLLIAVDLTGTFYGMRAVIPHLKENGGGSIVNIGSVAGLVGQCGTNGYTAAKGGVIALTKAAATEFSNDLIRVNCVCPTTTVTEKVQKIFDTMEGAEEWAAAERAYPRFGYPEDHANAVLFMSSDEASYITGQILCVDGGYTAR